MFEIFKTGKINKLTADHSEKLSDSTILMNIVNAMDARNNLTPEQFQSFSETFSDIKKRKDERMTNLLQYQHRAFAIAYEFEWLGEVPYEKICGDSKEILYVYVNTKPKFDEAVCEIIDTFSDIIDSIVSVNNLDAIKTYSLACNYFNSLSINILQSNSDLYNNILTCFMFEVSYKKYMVKVMRGLGIDKSQEKMEQFNSYRRQMKEMSQQAYDNCDTLDKFIGMLTSSFLSLAGAGTDSMSAARLISMANTWKES